MERKNIRVIVPTEGRNDTEIRYDAVQAMKAKGATEIRDFSEVRWTQRDKRKAGGARVRVFRASAVKEEVSVG